ncbi:MAG: transposase, partial [Chloroflexi bacterium]
MSLILSHKIRIQPNNVQETYFKKACGCRRLAYNWAVATIPKIYAAGEKTSKYDISKRFNAIKKENYSYVFEVSKWSVQMGIFDAWESYIKFWKKTSKGHPKFKKKGKSRDSFYIGSIGIKVDKRRLKIPKLSSSIKMSQEIRFPGKLISVTIGKDDNKWYATFSIEVDKTYKYPHTCKNQAVCGIDMGLTNLMIVSDG